MQINSKIAAKARISKYSSARSLKANITSYASARYASEAFFAIRGLLLARLLGPLTFGIWTQMRLVQNFLQFIRLGTTEALLRDYPFHKGSGALDHAELIKRVVSGFNLITTCAAFALIGFWLAFQPPQTITHRHYWLIWLAVFACNQIYWFIHCQLQAEKEFVVVSRMLLGFSLLSTIVGLVCAYYFTLSGFLAALLISYSVVIFYACGGKLSILAPAWNKGELLELIKTGLPIMISNALLILTLNVDKLTVWLLLDNKYLGIYAVQAYITNFIMLAPGSFAIVLFPTMMEAFGKAGEPDVLVEYLIRPSLLFSYLFCPILGLFFFLFHLPIRWLLPEYVQSIEPGKILILASYFLIVSRMAVSVLISLGKQKLLTIISALSALLAFLADYYLISSGKGLIGAAFGSSLGFMFYCIFTIGSALMCLRLALKPLFAFQLKMVLPFIFMLVSILCIERMIAASGTTFMSDLIHTVLKCIVYLAVTGLPFYFLSKKFELTKLSTLANIPKK